MRGKWLIATAIAAMLLGGLGTAGAAKLISGKDVRDRSIRGRDIAKNSVYSSNLSEGLRKTIFQQQASSTSPGGTGQQGTKGAKGDTGAAGPQGAKGDTGASGSTGAAGSSGEPGAPVKVSELAGNLTNNDGTGDVWDQDTFNCNNPNTGEQGVVNGIQQKFNGENAPLNTGAFFTRNGGEDCVREIDLNEFEGVKLADLDEVRYSEIFADSDANNTHAAPYMLLRVDRNGGAVENGDTIDVLFFVPANQNGLDPAAADEFDKGNPDTGPAPKQGADAEGVWQSWNVLVGLFGVGGDPGDGYTNLKEYLDANPDATLRASQFEGAIRVYTGSGQSTDNGYSTGIDNILISTRNGNPAEGAGGGSEHTIIYDFEAS